jgi:hypothetical protein
METTHIIALIAIIPSQIILFYIVLSINNCFGKIFKVSKKISRKVINKKKYSQCNPKCDTKCNNNMAAERPFLDAETISKIVSMAKKFV